MKIKNKNIGFAVAIIVILATMAILWNSLDKPKQDIHKKDESLVVEKEVIPERNIGELGQLEVVETKEEKEKEKEKLDEPTQENTTVSTEEIANVDTSAEQYSTETVVTTTEIPTTETIPTTEAPPTTEQPITYNEKENETQPVEVKHKGKTISVSASHYQPMCYEGCTGKTSTGIDVSSGTTPSGQRVIAVDPNVIPLGSKVRVDTPYGSFNAIAGDTGGGINGNTIDILVGSQGEAIQKGRVNATVTVVE